MVHKKKRRGVAHNLTRKRNGGGNAIHSAHSGYMLVDTTTQNTASMLNV